MKIDNWQEEFDALFGPKGHPGFPRKMLLDFIKEVVHWTRVDVEMTESIKRYNQAKEDGTLDKHFRTL